MKTNAFVLLLLIVFAAKSVAEDGRATMFGVWKVNWDRTSPTILAVPKTYAERFKTVEEFRAFVAKQAMDMTFEIQPDNIAFSRRATGNKPVKYRWESSKRYDCWLEVGGFLAASVGHGFKVTDANNAVLTFQIEWSENIATRVPLFMERQAKAQPSE